ncbi:MAG: crossover junction endodeoxyribonuclease RuvC [Bacteroidetes bacterium]|nr:MAG: crossover junction endodeoxyribonuclease RuvC [Bacteroidota bacterium]
MGYGVVLIQKNKLQMVSMGVIDLSKLANQSLKLKKIFERCLFLIDEYKPDELAIEAPFYGKNVQSMLKLGRAQGVAIASALYREIPVFEYSPKKIKQSITGNGNASKEQVAGMLKTLLNIDKLPKYLDATDGIAAAVCHFYQSNSPAGSAGKKHSGWESFIKDNPGRIT